MKAYLYDLKIDIADEKYSKENEFIVVSDNDLLRDREAERIYEWYINNTKKEIQKAVLGKPQIIENELISEKKSVEIDWHDCQERQRIQTENRTRGTGCIFRGGAVDPVDDLSIEELKELRESIEYFMDDHRHGINTYLFVGSKWNLDTRLRQGKIKIFDASGIELAADIVQLHFLSPKSETTFINWCCPIYIK